MKYHILLKMSNDCSVNFAICQLCCTSRNLCNLLLLEDRLKSLFLGEFGGYTASFLVVLSVCLLGNNNCVSLTSKWPCSSWHTNHFHFVLEWLIKTTGSKKRNQSEYWTSPTRIWTATTHTHTHTHARPLGCCWGQTLPGQTVCQSCPKAAKTGCIWRHLLHLLMHLPYALMKWC